MPREDSPAPSSQIGWLPDSFASSGETTTRPHDLEQMQRVHDERRSEDVVNGERLTVEERVRVSAGIGALIDGDLRELAAGGAVFVHVAGGDQRIARVDAHRAVRDLELTVGQLLGRAAGARRVEGLDVRCLAGHAEDSVGEAGLDGGGRAPYHAGGRGATEIDDVAVFRVDAEIFAEDGGPHLRLLRDRLADQQAVDIADRKAGVEDGMSRDVGPDAERALAVRRAGGLHLADSGDGGGAL